MNREIEISIEYSNMYSKMRTIKQKKIVFLFLSPKSNYFCNKIE